MADTTVAIPNPKQQKGNPVGEEQSLEKSVGEDDDSPPAVEGHLSDISDTEMMSDPAEDIDVCANDKTVLKKQESVTLENEAENSNAETANESGTVRQDTESESVDNVKQTDAGSANDDDDEEQCDEPIDSDSASPALSCDSAKNSLSKRNSSKVSLADTKSESDGDEEENGKPVIPAKNHDTVDVVERDKEASRSPKDRGLSLAVEDVSEDEFDETEGEIDVDADDKKKSSQKDFLESSKEKVEPVKSKDRCKGSSASEIRKEIAKASKDHSDGDSDECEIDGDNRDEDDEGPTHNKIEDEIEISQVSKEILEDDDDEGDENETCKDDKEGEKNVTNQTPIVVKVCTFVDSEEEEVNESDHNRSLKSKALETTSKRINAKRRVDVSEESISTRDDESRSFHDKSLNESKGEKSEKSDDVSIKDDKAVQLPTLHKRTKESLTKHKLKADKVKTKDCKLVGKNKSAKTEEGEMSTLAILDVRTVVEEEQSSNDKDATGKIKDSEFAKDSEGDEEEDEEEEREDASNDDSSRSSRDKASKSLLDKSSGIEAIANKLTKKSEQSTEDNEMKNYAADTMNELLGLFGYEKVDDKMKDAIQLSNNLAGPSNPQETDDEKSNEKDANTTASPVKKEAAEQQKTASNAKKEETTDNNAKDEEKSGEETDKKMNKNATLNATVKTTQGRKCSVCEKTRSCKYQVLMLGTTKFLCDDNCFREFRTKQKITTAPAIKDIIAENRPITRSLTNPKDHCNVCHKEIKNGMGLLPGVGENKPLCSEDCMKQYQATQGLKRACAQCGNHIQSRSKCLTWEAMEFCNEECLGKYQSYLGSHCAYCNNAVQQTSLGKYCVRFGSDIKQFCSNSCLEEFKKGLKVCSYCQKDISTGTEGFLAPVGDKGQFKEFCSQSCMEKYETMGSVTPSQPTIEQCSVCNKVTSVKVEVTFEGKVHKLCSEPCIAAFRYANKINTSICDTCHKFFDLDVTRQLTIQFEGTSKRFCTKACMNVFVLYHRKVVPCSWCKVKKYNFDMIERVDSNNHVQLFCSLNCLSLFRVSLNATSSRRIQCDFCHQVKPAQYHLTMSDASIRNFCSYNCVMQFQSQFTSVAQVVTPPQTTRTTTNTQTAGTPVISSVMSLAPNHTQTSTSQSTQKSVVVRSPAVPTLPVTKSTVLKTTYTQTLTPVITQQVVIKQPPAKPQKNKMLMCRPQVQTKGVSCKPHPCHKTTQTEDDYHSKPVLIPVPVPIYVPVPMRMYTTPVPFPLAFPLPIPVPIFIPTTKNSAHSIFKQIKEIQQKIPDNPFEADLILMAEMVAEDSAAAKDKQTKRLTDKPEPENQESSGGDAPDAPSNDLSRSPKQEEGFIVEPSLPDSCPASNTFGDDVLQMALRMASTIEESVGLDSSLNTEQSLSGHSQDLNQTEGNGGYLSPREMRGQGRNQKRSGSRVRGRGRKRPRVDEALDRSVTPSQTPPPVQTPVALVPPMATQFDFRPIGPPQIESNCVLKYSYGVNAWKHWVLQKNTQLEKASQTNRKLKLFKTDILQLSADELNYSLCLFVKEVRKPNGDEYAPDSIYYLCLGIQQYLFENGRIDNIFSDAYYEKFTECLNEVLQRYELTLTSDGYFLSRIEEEILWECKQLGAHSPHVLLNTLMYFNTKYFMLKSVDDHLQLSFSHILKHWKKTPGSTGKGSVGGRNVLLRYYPPSQMKDSPRRRKESIPSYEQVENLDNPLRCPVKLYEFYLSKCPECIKNRSDIFYLYPERSCVPDSPVWYSTMPLGKDTIAKMLQRIRMVREVGEAAVNNS